MGAGGFPFSREISRDDWSVRFRLAGHRNEADRERADLAEASAAPRPDPDIQRLKRQMIETQAPMQKMAAKHQDRALESADPGAAGSHR